MKHLAKTPDLDTTAGAVHSETGQGRTLALLSQIHAEVSGLMRATSNLQRELWAEALDDDGREALDAVVQQADLVWSAVEALHPTSALTAKRARTISASSISPGT
ncbi:MAG TPA: hypothetical protein VNF75_00050 [Candidatus Dormibacteraeota bacterium]|nr:hypothetical protein [Candidatus Dormibacteraeota bacterium]